MNYSYTLTTNGHDGSYYQIADPTTPFQPHLAAHYVNDCVRLAPILARVATADATIRNWTRYNKAAAHSNVAIVKNESEGFVKIVATKDIKKRDEILVSYGFQYWLRVPETTLKGRLRDCKDKTALKNLFNLETIAKAYA
jgi:SET domain-containing protein